MIRLNGDITRSNGMWHERIYEQDGQFILESQSEMMTSPDLEFFDELQDALQELLRRT